MLKTLAVAALSALLVAFLPAAGRAEEPATGSRTCTVARVEGTHVRYWQGEDWVALAVTELPVGATRVETGERTRIRIACSDGVVIAVGFGTEVDLTKLTGPAGGSRGILLDLFHGILGIVAPERNWSDFEVRTPLAIASVRSTEWLVEAASGAGTAVFVHDGLVEVRTDGGIALLSAGEGVDVAPGGTIGPVTAWGAARIARSSAAVGFDWQ